MTVAIAIACICAGFVIAAVIWFVGFVVGCCVSARAMADETIRRARLARSSAEERRLRAEAVGSIPTGPATSTRRSRAMQWAADNPRREGESTGDYVRRGSAAMFIEDISDRAPALTIPPPGSFSIADPVQIPIGPCLDDCPHAGRYSRCTVAQDIAFWRAVSEAQSADLRRIVERMGPRA